MLTYHLNKRRYFSSCLGSGPGGGLSVESVPSLKMTRPTVTTSALSRMPCSRQSLRPEEALLVHVGSYLEQIHEQIRTRSRVGQSIQPIDPAAPPVLPQSGTGLGAGNAAITRTDPPAPAQPVNSLPVKAKRSAKPSSE